MEEAIFGEAEARSGSGEKPKAFSGGDRLVLLEWKRWQGRQVTGGRVYS